MRHVPFLLAGFVLAGAASAAAQNQAPSVFATAGFNAVGIVRDGERSTHVGFDATVGGPSVRGFQMFGTFGRNNGFARQLPAWYASAGVRRTGPSLWRFRPYADASLGVARLVFNDWQPLTGPQPLTPMVGAGVGVHLPIGSVFTVDAGYRLQRFLGDVNATRANPVLGFGVSF